MNTYIKKITIISILAVLLVSFNEIIFFIGWKLTKLKYFENLHNYNDRIERTTKIEFKKIATQEKIVNYKIALFGASTLAGVGASLNIEELLKSKNFLNKNNFIVHNYAISGKPFSGHQYKLLKKVINNYEYIFIYAGHNMLKMIHETDGFKEKNLKFHPNGYPLMAKNSIYPTEEELNDQIKNITLNYNISEKIINFFVNHSRTYFFLKRVKNKTNLLNFSKKNYKTEVPIKIKYSHSENFYNYKTKNNIIKIYKQTLNDIIDNKKKDQKIIISTVASNIFFSPFGDSDLLVSDEKQLDLIYKKLNQNYNFKQTKIDKIKYGSNKFYLLGLDCLERNGYTLNKENIKCYKFLEKSRSLDTMPFRVLPEINEFIRSLKGKDNLIIIDFEKEILKKIKNKDDYLSYFVDFVHLSPKGHLFLTNLLLSKIEHSNINLNFDLINVDNCGNTFYVNYESGIKDSLINIPFERCKWPLMAIERVLFNQLKYFKKTLFYDYYIDQLKIN